MAQGRTFDRARKAVGEVLRSAANPGVLPEGITIKQLGRTEVQATIPPGAYFDAATWSQVEVGEEISIQGTPETLPGQLRQELGLV